MVTKDEVLKSFSSGAGQAVTRVGEAAITTKLATHIEAPVLLV